MPSNVYEDTMVEASMTQGQPLEFQFKNKQVIEIPDSQNNNYSSGQVVYDLRQLATNKGFMDLQGADIQLPIKITLTAAGAHLTAETLNSYAVSIKNCVYQLIHSIDFNVNGQSMVQAQPWLGIIQTYLLLSSWSQDDAALLGPEYLFSKDSVESLDYSAVLGETNTGLVERAVTGGTQPGSLLPANQGRVNRIRFSAASITDALRVSFGQTGMSTTRRSFCDTSGTQTVTWNLMLTIPLKGLHDCFEKFPLSRGSLCTLTINTNMPCESQIAATSAAPSVYTAHTVNVLPNQVMPFMLSTGSSAAGSGLVIATNTTLKLRGEIGNTLSTTTVIRVPLYEFNPQAETAYLANPVRPIRYNDFVTTQMQTTANESRTMFQISPGQARVRRLVMFPCVSAVDSSNGTGNVSAVSSMLSSCPGTAAPFVAVSNFNVYISGSGIYQQPRNYSYQTWLDEVKGSGSVNGGFSDAVRSGLINKYDFDTAYGIIDVDLSRHAASDDPTAPAIHVSLNVQCTKALTWFVYLFYEKNIGIDCDSGQLIM